MGGNATFYNRSVRHDGEVRLRASNSVEVKFTETDGLVVCAVESQAQTECRLFVCKVSVLDCCAVNWAVTERGELELDIVLATELLLGIGGGGKDGNQGQGRKDVLHLVVSLWGFRAQEKQFRRSADTYARFFHNV